MEKFTFNCLVLIFSVVFKSTAAMGQAALPVISQNLVNGIDQVDNGVVDGSFDSNDIYRLGSGLQLWGDTLVLGNNTESQDDNPSLNRGHVVTLIRDPLDPTVWNVSGYLSDSRLESRDEYAHDIAMEGVRMAVSSRRFDSPGAAAIDAGAVLIYNRVAEAGSNWQLHQEIYNPSPVEGERFGHSIALDGQVLVVSAQRAFFSDLVNTQNYCGILGEIYIYELDQLTGMFNLVADFSWPEIEMFRTGKVAESPDTQPDFCPLGIPPVPDGGGLRGAGFGKDVAIDGEWIAASTEIFNQVAMFRKVSGVWVLHSFLEVNDPSVTQSGDWGTSISMSDGRIAVGAKKHSFALPPQNRDDGMVSLFYFDSSADAWINSDNITINDVSDSLDDVARFGRSVYLDGLLLVVSCQIENGSHPLPNGGNTADLYTFVIDPSNNSIVPQGRIYYIGDGVAYDGQSLNVGVSYDRLSGLVAAGDTSSGVVPTNELRFFPACAADLNGDLVLDSADYSEFWSLLASGSPRVDFAKPFGASGGEADFLAFNRLFNLGCP